MNLTSYNSVQDAIKLWLDRPDLNENIPTFISLAEKRLNRILYDNVNLVRAATVTVSDGVSCLPDDFNGIVALSNPSASGGPLDYLAPAVFFGLQPSTGGQPVNYTLSADKLYTYPTTGISLSLRYRTTLDALKYGPNWLLDNHPDAYVFGALVEAADFIADARAATWQAKFDRIMSEINSQAQDIAYGGPLQLKSSIWGATDAH